MPAGRLYAYYLDAVEWCGDRAGTSANEGRDPLCGGRMGPPVSEGCSRAENVGYWTECCVNDITARTRPGRLSALRVFNSKPCCMALS